MNVKVIFFCFVGYLNLAKVTGHEDNIRKLLKLLVEARRHISRSNVNVVSEADALLPGHTLIRPEKAMLQSAITFPHDDNKLVYGNKENLGITYDKTPYRVLYTGFRKGNNILATLLKSAKAQGFDINMDNPSVVIIQKKKLKSGPKGKQRKLTDKTLTIQDVLKSIKNSGKHDDDGVSENIILKKPANKMRKKKDKIFGRPGQLHLISKTKKETLDERTKRIQDILNGAVPVVKTKSPTEDNSKERARNVKEYLDNFVSSKEKLSVDKKTKYIEDFLNNKVQVVTGLNSLNDKYANLHSKVQNSIDENENNANEILDQDSSEENQDNDGLLNTRRAKKKKKKKHRERDSKYESSDTDPSDISASSDYERNPGNPFTIHRNKYKQNWLWNHFMDGDHMNLNPFGPPFANMGPSGVDLFFGRKWWYYNQDDYKPMG